MEFVGINKLSLLDYPGHMSAILYMSACNFRCPFCHNGNTLLEGENDILPFDDILSFLKKRIGILDGVVISGGEPTLMSDLEEKIIKIRELGYKIKLDTNGSNPKVLKDLLSKGLIDYVAMDIKNSLKKYSLTTDITSSFENEIKESISILINSNIDYEFRTTLISEFHNEEDIVEIAKMLKGAKALYLQQFQISDGVLNKNLHPVDESLANQYLSILAKTICKVELRGY